MPWFTTNEPGDQAQPRVKPTGDDPLQRDFQHPLKATAALDHRTNGISPTDSIAVDHAHNEKTNGVAAHVNKLTNGRPRSDNANAAESSVDVTRAISSSSQEEAVATLDGSDAVATDREPDGIPIDGSWLSSSPAEASLGIPNHSPGKVSGDPRIPTSSKPWNSSHRYTVSTSAASGPPGLITSNGAALSPNTGSERLSARPPSPLKRVSSPAVLPATAQSFPDALAGPSTQQEIGQHRQRQTLQVPKISAHRTSRDSGPTTTSSSEDVISASGGRLSPTITSVRRPSLSLGRRMTRSIHSEMYLEDVPQDEDAARWAEVIRQRRASKRKRKEEEEEDDRVVVGTRIDQNHVNWVTAYNMLTGIRFTVSRTNAKLDRELTDADFTAKHKFSFDITGNELTPSAKYDFKFKDYAPWVFRHLRSKFKIDPADYLISLTSKYILSELGSPGKSGSFFYFSRDYKYIIKTIHHAEHKFLRKILKEYYLHVQKNPNTLLSQFYGLHRVKIPYGRKIHFVVMNNLFPPHRDIHQTFDLKGSTVGRDFHEEDLQKNPRATLKDLNWLRRNYHLEFGPMKKDIFFAQMERDVQLLQRLKIMDYSLLVGIHDLEKGNEENLRDKTLRVFQPGGERSDDVSNNLLMRTPSKLENARKARELRQIMKKEKPIPMEQSMSKMPDTTPLIDKNFVFYSDDGGFRATHEDNRPGEEIYYLGIIDCLTHYGFIKKTENFLKGFSHTKSQISAVPPEPYGDRFLKFITGITMTKEEADREKEETRRSEGSLGGTRLSGQQMRRSSTNKVIDKAEKQAEKSIKRGATEDTPDRVLSSIRSPSAERTDGLQGATLPIVEEAGEAGSSRSGESRQDLGGEEDGDADQPPPPISKQSQALPELPLTSSPEHIPNSNKTLPPLPPPESI